tara:strand:+ start:2042 stop:2794 length:753 start_codon:yes stop_codon:yes gene_type:complete
MKTFITYLEEAKVPKPSAVWVVGGAASGKSTIAENAIVRQLKFELIDVDEPFEKMLKKFSLSSVIEKPPPKTAAQKAADKLKTPVKMSDLEDPMDFFKDKKPSTLGASAVAREITKRRNIEVTEARKNVVFVETGGQIGAIKNKKKALEDLGYKTFIVFVGVHPELNLNKPKDFQKVLDTLIDRGQQRLRAGGRGLDPKILETSLKQTQKVKDQLVPIFGRNKLFIDTTDGNPTKNIAKTKRTIQTWMKR